MRSIYNSLGVNPIASILTEDPSFLIFPNPSNTQNIKIETTKWSGAKVSIFNILGDVLLSASMTSTEQSIDVSGLANGLYIIELISKEGTKSKSNLVIAK
ncbi:T9SS type A sorting domain-containing protein [Reichenbachiella versicolor]|uniref:T9SS type A sorting domain-containing protein n=1 Tax=Reichenbachiella versicolor TaxID=1821036 RepID=UPI0013A5725F|nr:T9SS type A sorting domain-containing protein [Reichenbachiella versicolor]